MCRICRICLEVVEESAEFFSLDTYKPDPDSISIKSKLKACIPEMALNVVRNAIICNYCSTTLNVAYEFRTKCLQTEEKICRYMVRSNSDLDVIDLRLIVKKELKFSDESKCDKIFDNVVTEAASENILCNEDSEHLPGCFEKCYILELPGSTPVKTEKCELGESGAVEDDSEDVGYKKAVTNYERIEFTESEKEKARNLKPHMRTQKGGQLINCANCNYSTINKKHLTVHMHLVHSGQKPFKCPDCEYSGASKSHLMRHSTIHTGLKPYKCTICNFSTAYKNNLKDHISIHDGYKPYKCDRCEFSTSTKQHLSKHIRIHTGDRPYKCRFCDFSSAYHSSLKKHLGIHNGLKPYKCPECEYSTTSKGRLKEHHADIHLGNRPYKCDKCDYSTARKGSHIQHMKLHTGSNQRVCKASLRSFLPRSDSPGNV